MTIKNNLYNPISIPLSPSRMITLGPKETVVIPNSSVNDYMRSLDKNKKIKIGE